MTRADSLCPPTYRPTIWELAKRYTSLPTGLLPILDWVGESSLFCKENLPTNATNVRSLLATGLKRVLEWWSRVAFLAGISLQISILWFFVYTTYPAAGNRANYYLPASISAIITSICASMSVASKSSKHANMLVWLYTTMLALMLGLVHSESIKICALIYELFMLLSIVAFHYSATSEKSKKILKDFVAWTQFGSLCLLIGSVGLAYDIGLKTFYCSDSLQMPSGRQSKYTWLILLGLLIKIPVVPLHFWITKVHVEASTSFSIFLSGFLVKTAAVFLVKSLPLLSTNQFFFLTTILVTSVLVSTGMLVAESDMKRFVAIGTIQEMGLAALILVIVKTNSSSIAGNVLLLHSLISIIMFWVADQLYCLAGHRSLNGTGGLWYVAPKTTVMLLSLLLLIRGVPVMFRYNIELQGFEALTAANPLLALLAIWTVVTASSVLVVYRVFKFFFGSPNKKLMPTEVPLREFLLPLIPTAALLYCPYI